MPMPAKGPHLALRKRKGREPVWVIRDSGKVERATGTGDRREAEKRLAAYLAEKHADRPAAPAGPLPPEVMTVAEVLDLYGTEHAPTVAAPERIGQAIGVLVDYWGERTVSAITKETCRQYLRWRRRGPGTMRYELKLLQTALTYAVKEGRLTVGRSVDLPDAPPTKQRALTRDEVARLLRVARHRREPYLARFILVALYTGSRKAAVLNLRLDRPHIVGGWFDLERGILHCRGEGERATAKRRPAARLPRQLLAHARRWRANGATWAVEYRGSRIAALRNGWEALVTEAALGWHPTPHTLKHTALTWFITAGGSIEDAVAYFGTSAATILRVYLDVSPHWQAGAVKAVEKMGRRG